MNNADDQQHAGSLYGAGGSIDGSDGNFLSNAHEILAAYSAAAAAASPSSLLNAYQQGQLSIPGMPQTTSATAAMLGGQFSRQNNIMNNPMMAMHLNSMASGGSNSFLTPNNNNLFGLNFLQQQLMQQQMLQGLQNQRMAQQVANPQFQINAALLQSLAAGRMLPMSTHNPSTATNAAQALLNNNNAMAALQNNHESQRRPQLETQLILPGNYRDFSKVSL
jgi:hypothetical protein